MQGKHINLIYRRLKIRVPKISEILIDIDCKVVIRWGMIPELNCCFDILNINIHGMLSIVCSGGKTKLHISFINQLYFLTPLDGALC